MQIRRSHRPARSVWAAVALLLGSVSTGVAAQDSTGCRSCEGHGHLPCKRHDHELEERVEFCSIAIACQQCEGALARDCKSCPNPAGDAALAKRRQDSAAWVAGRRQHVDERTRGKEIEHIRTRHVDLTFSVRDLTVGKQKLDQHDLMHLYAQRLEDLRQLFCDTLGVGDRDFSARLEIYVFRDAADHRALAPHVVGGSSSATSGKLLGATAVHCLYHDRNAAPGDEGLWRSLVHNVTHLLLANMKPAMWIGNRKSGWIDEGLAHWFEDKLTGRCLNYCYQEVAIATGTNYKGGRFRVPIRKLVDAGKLKSFSELATLNTDQLSGEDHAHAFACVDFLLDRFGGKQLTKLVRGLKNEEPLRDALQAACAIDLLQFDE